MGIKHVLVKSLDQIKSHSVPELRLGDSEYNKIRGLISDHMVLRFASPSRQLAWYSFKEGGQPVPIVMTYEDAQDYPVMVIAEARTRLSSGDALTAKNLAEEGVRVPMMRANKFNMYQLLSSAYNALGQKEKDEETSLLAASLFPELPEVHYNLAVVYYEHGPEKYDKAALCAEEALALRPDYMDAHGMLGNIYVRKNELDKGLLHLEKAIALGDKNPALLPGRLAVYCNTAGYVYMMRKDYDRALQFYEKAARLNPRDPVSWLNQSFIYRARGEYAKADSMFLQANRLKSAVPH